MKRTPVLVAGLGALVLLAGCGGGAPERVYTPAAAAPSQEKTAARSTPTETPGDGTISVGRQLRIQVDWPERRDPLLRLFVDYYVESWKAVVLGDGDFGDNLELSAMPEADRWVRLFTDKGWSMKGVTRLYDIRVKATYGKGAQVNTCVDETGLSLLSAEGQVVKKPSTWPRKPFLQAVIAHRDDQGTWRIRTFLNDKEGCPR
ncbi:hypothetical protein ABZ297_09100 [Nonomuraea sp. NPDC005983]|uniref:hypothetical protein n=1 Tax=Nonomuraea sp. NPDC005983 TaxID=3155595 RepID=UPI0033A46D58